MDYTAQGILQTRILEWVAFPFPKGSSQTRDRIQVSYIAGGFFTSWALDHNPHFILFSQNDLILQMTSKKWTVDWKTHEKKKSS